MNVPGTLPYPSLERVLDAAHQAGRTVVSRSAVDWMVSCPGPTHANDDRHPSLHVTWANGKTLLQCFAGCNPDDVIDALRLKAADLFDEPLPAGERGSQLVPRPRTERRTNAARVAPARTTKATAKDLGRPTGPWQIVGEWVYVDDDGQPYGKEVKKARTYERGVSKSFTLWQYDPQHPKAKKDGWAPGAPARPVLYRQPDVRTAVAAGELVVVAEGPKDADRVVVAGVCGTSTSGGAATWHDAYTEVLAGARRVWLVVDHDAAGYKRGLDVPRRLAGHVDEVRVMLPVPDFAKADASDHFDAGHGVDEFVPVGPAQLFARLADVAAYDAACWLARYLNNGGQLDAVVPGDARQLLVRLCEAETAAGVPVRDSVRDTLLAAAEASTPASAPLDPVAAQAIVAGLAGGEDAEEADDPQARLRPVPGSPAWLYLPGRGVWQFKRDELVQVLTWCPEVTRHLVAHSPRGEVTSRRVTIVVGEQSATVPTQEVADGKVWVDRFPAAAGVATREVRDVLRNIVDHQAAALPLIPVRPRWVDGQLVLPPTDAMPPGYCETAGTIEDFAALLRACVSAPRIALVMGLAVGGLYVEPLRRQSFIVHLGYAGRKGKSTALKAAAAIFGSPGEGEEIVRSWSSTVKGVPAALRGLAVMPAFRDELGAANLNISELTSLVFTITEGAIRDGSARDGSLRTTDGGWKGAFFSSGNSTIAGRIGNEGIGARVVDIDSAMTTSAAQSDEIKRLAQRGYGHGLPAIVARGLTPDDFEERADKAAVALGVADGGPQRTLGLHLSLGIAGAQLLAELTGVEELTTAALVAARQVQAELVDDLHERGANPGDRLLLAIADAMAVDPVSFPTREQYSSEVRQGQVRDVKGWDLADDDSYPGEVALIGSALREIAHRAGIEDFNIAIKDLQQRTPPLLHRDNNGKDLARVLQFPGQRRGKRAYLFSGVDAARHYLTHSDSTPGDAASSEPRNDPPPQSITTSVTSPVTTSEQRCYDCHDVSSEHISEVVEAPVLFSGTPGDAASPVLEGVAWHEQLDPPDDDGAFDCTAEPDASATASSERVESAPECDICLRPVDAEGNRHPMCAGYYRASMTWSLNMNPAAQMRPCEHCGDPCRLWWGEHCVHAECQYGWYATSWRAHQRPTQTQASLLDTPTDQPVETSPADAGPTPAGDEPVNSSPATKAPEAVTTAADSIERPAGEWLAGEPRAVVAVADVDGIHLPDGTVHPLPEKIEHIGHLAETVIALRLGWRYDRNWEVERGQLWLTEALVEQLGLPDKLPRDSDTKGWKKLQQLSWLSGARSDGWTVLNTTLRAWTSVWRQGGGGALIVVPHWLGRKSEKRFDVADVDAATLARRAQLFAGTVGLPYRNSAGHTGLRLLRWLHRSPQARQLTEPINLPVPARQHPIQSDLAWHRPLTATERRLKYVIGLDQNGCYINAANSLPVGADVDPVHVTGDGIEFSAKTPGYWRVRPVGELAPLLPNMLDPTGRGRLDDDSYWVMTPTVDFLRRERKVQVQVLEAYVWPPQASLRFYDEWAAHLRELIYTAKTQAGTDADIAALLPAFKGLYTAAIGDLAAGEGLMRPGDMRPPKENPERRNPLWRPDHRHLILARAQVGILRRAWTAGDATGMWPIAIHTDAIYYASDEPDPARLAAHLKLPYDLIKWGSFKPAPGGCAGPLTAELIEALDAERGWGTALDEALVDHDVWQARLDAEQV